ncbi:ATP-binding protein [Scleromatobacter humisilvae]|uniref:histidine kinase n=1 Tax=Scleromatobacter humisilvae TaxID=2897159 RepID=A0A9X2BYE2_9BURK|nr:ATP-binding protein [Scleromatobacter humisilvae]MCK9685533.1 HAMP domain-containing protein [Scleromatobacter humisilvae]
MTMGARMKALLADTLFKRLFALMWLALVVSHAVAFLVVTRNGGGGGRLPTFPSLPPFSFSQPAASPASATRMPPAPPDWRNGPNGPNGPGGMDGPHGPAGPPPFPGQRGFGAPPIPQGGGLPGSAALLDYGIRLLIIGLAAWFGARWLSAPMRRLQAASRTLGQSLARNEAPPQVDERAGTVEVREAAHVFNEMSRQLSDQVHSRALLVAAISHDLRTPLTRIRMRLESSETDPLTARSIADIHEMDDLIESALEVFRGTGGHEEASQVTDVNALVQAIVDDLADLGQPVSVQGEPAPAPVQSAGLRRVVSNLINNALRYGQRADISVRVHGDAVHIVIDDQGPGIPEAQLDAVMQPFYRLESSRSRLTGGSGLGLYIARDLIARQGGVLTLENHAEGGLRATIALKRA